MVVSLFNIWTIFFFTTIIFCIYVLIYINIIGGFKEIKWKIFYFFFSWGCTFIFLFYEIDIILTGFSTRLGDLLIIKDLQDLINLSLDLAIWLSFWFVLPLCCTLIWIYFTPLLNQQEYLTWSFFFVLCGFYIVLFKFLLDSDLFLASWEFFKKTPKNIYDFQPDFLYIIMAYLGDFFDLGSFFCLISLGLFTVFFFQYNIFVVYKSTKIVYYRMFLSFCFALIMFYFFGGESLIRDTILVIFIFFIVECYYFLYLFFFTLKRKKI